MATGVGESRFSFFYYYFYCIVLYCIVLHCIVFRCMCMGVLLACIPCVCPVFLLSVEVREGIRSAIAGATGS